MSKEEFQSNLCGAIYGNRALSHIFITICEKTSERNFTIDDLKEIVRKTPTIEHVLSQTPVFAPSALGFNDKEDFIDFEDTIGNLTILEKKFKFEGPK